LYGQEDVLQVLVRTKENKLTPGILNGPTQKVKAQKKKSDKRGNQQSIGAPGSKSNTLDGTGEKKKGKFWRHRPSSCKVSHLGGGRQEKNTIAQKPQRVTRTGGKETHFVVTMFGERKKRRRQSHYEAMKRASTRINLIGKCAREKRE